MRTPRRARARPLVAALALTTSLTARAAQEASAPTAQPVKQEAPVASPPPKSKSPVSQTPFTPLAIGEVEQQKTAAGTHWRIGTARGVVHLWRPRGYRAATAGTVIYLHGYYTNVDQAVEDHKLLKQFEDSRRNALFIVPEAPAWNGEEVFWPELDALLAEVARLSEVTLPKGPLVVIGHSGAYRTLLPWLTYEGIQEIILLDGLYRGEDELGTWLAAGPQGAKNPRRLFLVGLETARRTEAWLSKSHPGAIRHRRLPNFPLPAGAPERRAPVVYLRAKPLDHMEIVTEGTVMPELLRWTRLKGL